MHGCTAESGYVWLPAILSSDNCIDHGLVEEMILQILFLVNQPSKSEEGVQVVLA